MPRISIFEFRVSKIHTLFASGYAGLPMESSAFAPVADRVYNILWKPDHLSQGENDEWQATDNGPSGSISARRS